MFKCVSYELISFINKNGVYISQLLRNARACSLYSDFLGRYRILSTKVLNQVLGRDRSYFVTTTKTHSNSTKTISETDINNMLQYICNVY
jgi:hypothetical protein